jgi:hypothetical protein
MHLGQVQVKFGIFSTSTLFNQWHLAIAILSIPVTVSRVNSLKLLPVGASGFYQKKMFTCHHPAIGGVTLTTWQFIYYSRWVDVLPSPTLMTGHALPWTLQTALSDVCVLTCLPARGGRFQY